MRAVLTFSLLIHPSIRLLHLVIQPHNPNRSCGPVRSALTPPIASRQVTDYSPFFVHSLLTRSLSPSSLSLLLYFLLLSSSLVSSCPTTNPTCPPPPPPR